MLILTRKAGESIRIGDDIVIKIVDTDSRHVKIGIEAPRSVAVNRQEIFEKIQKENREASASQDDGLRSIADLLRSGNLKK